MQHLICLCRSTPPASTCYPKKRNKVEHIVFFSSENSGSGFDQSKVCHLPAGNNKLKVS